MEGPASPDSVFAQSAPPPARGVGMREAGAALAAIAALPLVAAALLVDFDKADEAARWLLLLVIWLAACAAAAAWLALRWLVKPLRQMAGALEHYERGHYRRWMQPQPGPLAELLVLHRGLHALLDGLDRRREARDEALQRLEAELVQRRQLLEEVAQRERAWREVFDVNPNVMWILEARTLHFLAVNEAAVRHYGYDVEAFLAKDLPAILAPNERDHLHLLEDDATGPGPRHLRGMPRVWRHVTADGRQVLVEMTRQAITFAGREAWLSMVTDVTQRVTRESQRSAQARVLSRRLADAQRELADARSLGEGLARLMTEELLPRLPREQAAPLEHGLRRVQRLARLPVLPFTPEPLDLTAIAEQEIHLLRLAEPARRVHVEIEPGLVCEGDAALARVLLQELLHNAWRFSEGRRNPWIRVGAVADAAAVPAFFISDNGCGFDDTGQARLFEPQDSPNGGRLGLALAAAVVRRHGGRVWAQSRPEEGATMFFRLSPGARRPGLVNEVVIDPVEGGGE